MFYNNISSFIAHYSSILAIFLKIFLKITVRFSTNCGHIFDKIRFLLIRAQILEKLQLEIQQKLPKRYLFSYNFASIYRKFREFGAQKWKIKQNPGQIFSLFSYFASQCRRFQIFSIKSSRYFQQNVKRFSSKVAILRYSNDKISRSRYFWSKIDNFRKIVAI